MSELFVCKIGGNVMDDEKALKLFLEQYQEISTPCILVHGGGKMATQLADKLGIETKMVLGRRVTDENSLKITVMTYAGWLNKTIVAKLNAIHVRALGISGADMGLITAHKRPADPVDFGWVGDIDRIDSETIMQLLQIGVMPVFCAVTSDGTGQLLNTNADTIAATVSSAMAKYYNVKLRFCFEKKGVLQHVDDENSVIHELTRSDFERSKINGSVHTGMLPKLENAFNALESGVKQVVIGPPDFQETGTKLIL